jgi:tetratricopeptide (TPR) repeat protein
MMQKIIEWFENLSTDNWIAVAGIVVPIIVAAVVGLFKLFHKEPDSLTQQKTIKQKGNRHTAIIADGNKVNIAGRDIHTGIESKDALNVLVETSAKLGRSEKEKEQLKERIKQLEEQLAKPALETSIAPEKPAPVPSAEARELAGLITQNDGPYALALKAIAEGNSEKADELLDETQQILDNVEQAKDKAQAKIYLARMQNASYAGRPRDALQYCDKLLPLAGDNTQIINSIAVVYYENAAYQKAEPLMRRALEIDEKSFGKDHPEVATDLNNLAQLLKDTNRLKEAEPLMRRVVEIVEKSLGPDHPNVATALNNLALLLQATNRLTEAEPLMRRALVIFENSLGPDHPKTQTVRRNLELLG